MTQYQGGRPERAGFARGREPSGQYWAQHAWLGPGRTASDVLISIEDGRFTAIEPDTRPPLHCVPLAGLTLPGFANTHSHAFHRGLRGRTHSGSNMAGSQARRLGTFWSWRDRMYDLAGRLTPDTYHDLAVATFAEMALAGITSVGEFHYLHHGPGGVPYTHPNVMGHGLIAAAAEAGIRITLLDTLYLTASVDGDPPTGPQLRFSDSTLDGWTSRMSSLLAPAHALIGTAIHSVRAVPSSVLPEFASRCAGLPVHVHVSEQRAENEACLAVYGRTPTQVLDDAGLITANLTAVHATHITDEDRTRLGDAGAAVCFCPTTERDLADGIGPARPLVDSGARLCLGSDSHAVIDPLEEARAVELNERLRDEHRGHFDADELLTAATRTGHQALGWSDAGVIEPGARADLVSVRLDTVRTAGVDAPEVAAVFAATAGDVTDVIVDGVPVVRDGRHVRLDVPASLARSIEAAWR